MGNTPEKQFRIGNTTASVWKRELPQGKGTVHSIQPQTFWKDKDGAFQYGTSFNRDDIPKLIVALQRAYEWTFDQRAENKGKGDD